MNQLNHPYTSLQLANILLVLLINIPAFSIGQDQGESSDTNKQIDSLYDQAWQLARERPEESLNILAKVDSLHVLQDTPYRADVVDYYYGIFYKNLNRYTESEEHFNRYEAYHAGRQDTLRLALVAMAKANLFSDYGNLDRSMEAASTSLSLYDSLHDTTGMIRAGSKMGYLLSEVERYDRAMEYHRRSNEWARQMGNVVEEQNSYTNMAIVYEKQGLLDSAYAAYEKAYEIGEMQDDAFSKVLNRYNLAVILQKMDQYEASLPYISSSMSLADSAGFPSLQAGSRFLMAEYHLHQNNPNKAISLLKSVLQQQNYDLSLRDKKELHELLARAYYQTGEYSMAYENHLTFKSLNDSLLSLDSRNQLNKLEIQYESEKQKQRIAFLDLEKEAAISLIRQKDRTILIGAIGLILISLLASVLYLLFRKYQRQKKNLASALSDKEVLLREIHHRVKNNLQIISSLLSLQGRSLDDETALQAITAGKSRVRSMALIHQNLYQHENLTGVNVKTYLKKLCSELFSTFDVDENRIGLDLQAEELMLDVDTLVPLGLIVNELVTNALKYAFPDGRSGTMTVLLRHTGDVLILEVADDGVGYDPGMISDQAFGQKLVRSLLHQIKGKMKVDSGKGTKVTIEVYNSMT